MRPVTLDRVTEVLSDAGRQFYPDEDTKTVVILLPQGTTYLTIHDCVLRMHTVWRGILHTEALSSAIPLVLQWNRERPGPKVVVHQGTPVRITTETNCHLACGLDDFQLQAQILLGLILASRFFVALEDLIPPEPAWNDGPPHEDFLERQDFKHSFPMSSDNTGVHPVDSSRVISACKRLGLQIERSQTLLTLSSQPFPTTIRLFGEDTWLSVSSHWDANISRSLRPELFDVANAINRESLFPVVSLLLSHENASARADFIVSVGEGMTDCQLDTQISLGLQCVRDATRTLTKAGSLN